jgi:protein-tyrosine phosphatase
MIPYMSIDLLFFAAAFLCRDEREMRIFARRVVFAILVAAAFFMLLPLKLAWPERPRVDGWFGDYVESSCTVPFLMEYPHNLFPSLHITLCMILVDLYARHTRGLVRLVVYVWFSLIGLSAVLTYQHHLVDVLGGVGLAVLAFYLFRESSPEFARARNLRIALYYGLGAGAALVLTWAAWAWGGVLLWPAFGLGLLSAAYCGLGPGVYCKSGGRLPLSTRILLGPILVGQYLSLLYYRRQCRAWDEITPGLLMGRTLNQAEAVELVRQGVTAVLDLTAEFSEVGAFRAVTYRNVPILDLTAPTLAQIDEAVWFMSKWIGIGKVYVHCKIGYSRSAAVVGAYLLECGKAQTAEEAIAQMRQRRPSIVVRPEVKEALRNYEHQLSDSFVA